MTEKRRPSTNHPGAVTLHPRMWGRIFEYVDDSLDDLARVKAAGCLLVCCKDLKRILAAGGAELWLRRSTPWHLPATVVLQEPIRTMTNTLEGGCHMKRI